MNDDTRARAMEKDEQQDRRDERKEKERTRMVVHKVKSPRTGERMLKVVLRRANRGPAPPRRSA